MRLLVSAVVLFKLKPQSEKYLQDTLSPETARFGLLKYTVIVRELTLPESIVARAPMLPAKDHWQFVIPTVVPVAEGNSGTEKRYLGLPHIRSLIFKMVILAGEGISAGMERAEVLIILFPQDEL